MTVGWRQGSDIDAQAARNRRANGIGVEPLPFDFTGFEYVFGEHLERSLISQFKTQAFHAAQQSALRTMYVSQ
jgi:hypothetical protein